MNDKRQEGWLGEEEGKIRLQGRNWLGSDRERGESGGVTRTSIFRVGWSCRVLGVLSTCSGEECRCR